MAEFMTLEELAWKLVMNEEFEPQQIQCLIENNNNVIDAGKYSYDSLCGEFEMLISLLFEMLFYAMKNNFLQIMNGKLESGEIDTDEFEMLYNEYEPDLSAYSIDDIKSLMTNIYDKIGYIFRIDDISETCPSIINTGPHYTYYCKTYLLDDKTIRTRNIFESSTHIPEGKRYTFLSRYIEQEEIDNIRDIEDFNTIVQVPALDNGNYNGNDYNLSNNMRIFRIKFIRI